jgi:imidazolonepropionase-like amidohydrolase
VAVGTWADLLVVNGAPLADVTMLRQRESLTLVMQDGLANAETLKPARRDGS